MHRNRDGCRGHRSLSTESTQETYLDLIEVFRFYHRHREHLLWGRMLPPGEMRCREVLVRFMQRFIFTPAAEVRLVDLPRPQVLQSSWVSPSGQALLMLVNPTRQPAPLGFHPAPGWQAVPSSADGLRVQDGWLRGCLAPRSLTAVVLEPTARGQGSLAPDSH